MIRAKGTLLGAPDFSGELGTDGYYPRGFVVASCSATNTVTLTAVIMTLPGAEDRAHENVLRRVPLPSIWRGLWAWLT